MTNLRHIDEDTLAVAQRLLHDGTLTESGYLSWAMAEAGVSHRAIADYRQRSKGTVTEQITRARRLIAAELDAQDAG